MVLHLRQYLRRVYGKPAGISPGRNYLEECESVRGWAILLVFGFHWQGGIRGYGAFEGSPSPLLSFLYAGNTGVTLFFVLSGFLLSLPFLKNPDYSIRTFYANRLLRIMPLYALVVVAVTVWTGRWMEGVKALFFYDIGLTTLFPFGTVWWSLVTEMQFYLLMPLLMYLIGRGRRGWLGWVLLLVASLVYVGLASQGLFADNIPLRGKLLESIVGRWPNFLAGAMIAWIYTRFTLGRILHSSLMHRGGADLLVLSTIVAIAYSLQEVARMGIVASQLTWHYHNALEGLLWALLIFLLINTPVKLKRLFVNPAFSFFGVLSYSIYLIHAPVLIYSFRYARREAPALLAFADGKLWLFSMAIFLAVVLISMLSYGLIERPFLQLKQRVNRG